MIGVKMVSCKVLFNEETKMWERLSKDDPRREDPRVIDMGERLTNSAEKIKKRLRKDLDFSIIITGEVGSGKSNLGRCFARFVSDEKFHPKTHVVKTAKDIETIFKKAKQYEAVIFDEGSLVFSSTNTLTKETKYANAVLDVCRQRNLVLIIIAPKFHRIGASVAVERTKMLIYTYMKKGSQRGPYKVYGDSQKEKLYYLAKKDPKLMHKARPKWKGWCHEDKTYTKEYKEMKDETYTEALEMLGTNTLPKINAREIEKNFCIKIIMNNPDRTNRELAELVGRNISTIEKYKKEIREVTSKITREKLGIKIPALLEQQYS